MKVFLVITWLGGQAQIPLPDLMSCQYLAASVYSKEAESVVCIPVDTMKPGSGVQM